MSRRVLVVDDDEAVRKSFCLALEDTAFSVDTADSGETGVRKVETDRFDLVFLDLKMPGINGVETLRRIREKDRRVPVYIITAFHREFLDQLTSIAEAGIEFEVLQKPIGLDRIVAVTKSILEGPLQI